MIWSIIQTIGGKGISFILFSVLALLLSPKDFGFVGMAVTWIAFITAFSEMGFGAALIQRKNVDSTHYNAIFFVNIAVGVLLTLMGIILSTPCALFFNTPEVKPIMAVLSFGLLINSFSLTQVAIAQREIRFKDLAIRDIISALIGGIAGIILAFFKYGVWSLVVQSLATYTFRTLLLWGMTDWRPSYREFSMPHAKELWPYSSKIFAFNILKYFTSNIDRLIIGHFFSPMSLGLYIFANQIVLSPISSFVGAVGNYLFTKFSRMQEDLESMKSSYLFFTKMINTVVTPIMVVTVLLSPVIIPGLFGEKWIDAVPLIQILTILGVMSPWISNVGHVMKALDRPGWLFNWAVFITALVSGFIWIGSTFGISGSIIGLEIAYICSLPVILWILSKLLFCSFKDIMDTITSSLLAGGAAGVIFWWLLKNADFLNSRKIYVIFPNIIMIFIAYLVFITLIDRPFVHALFKRFVKRFA